MAVSLSKVRELTGNDENMVNLVKAASVSLQKHVQMAGHEAKVALVMDYSFSMQSLFAAGVPQALGERALAAGTRFDDDGEIDVFVFGEGCEHVGGLSLTDYRGGIDRLCNSSHDSRKYTFYDRAIDTVSKFYGFSAPPAAAPKRGLFRQQSAAPAQTLPPGLPADLPVYVIFVTDGAPSSQPAATTALVNAARFPIFWQFMGVGDGDFSFLEQMDEMEGRFVDNANFFEARNPLQMSDQDLFDKMLGEYPEWVPLAKQLGLIR